MNNKEQARYFVDNSIKGGFKPCTQLIDGMNGFQSEATSLENMSEMMGIIQSRDTFLYELTVDDALRKLYLTWWEGNTNQLMLLDNDQKVNVLTVLSCVLFLENHLELGIQAITHARELQATIPLCEGSNRLTVLVGLFVEQLEGLGHRSSIPQIVRSSLEQARKDFNINNQPKTEVV
jgi:hypothetical protein